MLPAPLSIADLFQQREQYLIPLFQRGYVWTLTHQIQPLWEDIVDRVEALKEHRENAQKVGGAEKLKPLRKHFLGAIVVGSPVDFDTQIIPTREVIDGQQRITSLQIMLLALRDLIVPLNDATLTADVRVLTFNNGEYRRKTDHRGVDGQPPSPALSDDRRIGHRRVHSEAHRPRLLNDCHRAFPSPRSPRSDPKVRSRYLAAGRRYLAFGHKLGAS